VTVVREFHIAVDQPWSDRPVIPAGPDVQRRIRLIKEECEEVLEELVALLEASNRSARLPEVLAIHRRLLKELADLRYVTEGTAVEFGLPIDDAFLAVHLSNMTKRFRDGSFHKDPGGKVLKGEDYQPADMEPLVPDPTDVDYVFDGGVCIGGVSVAAGPGVTFKT
jgi:predicted HAD superfamily Cof-like phosphohydrolase